MRVRGAFAGSLDHAHVNGDAPLGAAIGFANDNVLGDVDETPSQVAGVRRAERCVGESLARAVGRDEVLEHRQPFAEVRFDRTRDDVALGVRDETAHSCDLADLLDVSARARSGHHVDRIQRRERLFHGVRYFSGRLGPDLDEFLPPLAFGDDTLRE